MGWFIASFVDDLTVSMVSEKWPKKNFKKCYFPKTKTASKIRKETPVDKESGEWGLHPCKILMRGRKYSTFDEARKAEKIAQNYSTMTSFENSYVANQAARKRPNVYNDSSVAESDSEDGKKIKKLEELDGGSCPSSNKEYTYHRSDSLNDVGNVSLSSEGEDYQNCEEDEGGVDGSGSEGSVSEGSGSEGSGSDDMDNNITSEENGESDADFNIENECVNVNSEEGSGNDNEADENLESTSVVRSPAAEYDFSDDRRLVRVEKLLMHACHELESIKDEMKALKIKSNETEQVVERLVLVCKDLSVEVFACTEELKKRNGMFTDLLVPDLKLTVKRRKDYKANELALGNNKVADNMIKYLASTVNETKEKTFIAGCYKAIFDVEFLTKKVWWKSEPGKVVIKKSRILHCMTESFKLKFGLVEPRKTDKQIVALIYKICRNIKDNYRKGLKKAREAAENAEEDAAEKAEEDAEETVKKSAKKTAKKNTNQTAQECSGKSAKKDKNDTAQVCSKKALEESPEEEWDIEDFENYKKHKKAKRDAKKAKLISELSSRDGHMTGNPEVKRGKKRLAVGDTENDAKKQKKIL